jgi:hypothetical protein
LCCSGYERLINQASSQVDSLTDGDPTDGLRQLDGTLAEIHDMLRSGGYQGGSLTIADGSALENAVQALRDSCAAGIAGETHEYSPTLS